LNFFANCQTKDQAKEIYRKLAKHFHPDKGGDVDLMKELQNQYDNVDKYMGKSHKEYKTFHPYDPSKDQLIAHWKSQAEYYKNISSNYPKWHAEAQKREFEYRNKIQSLNIEIGKLKDEIRQKEWITKSQSKMIDDCRNEFAKPTIVKHLHALAKWVKKNYPEENEKPKRKTSSKRKTA